MNRTPTLSGKVVKTEKIDCFFVEEQIRIVKVEHLYPTKQYKLSYVVVVDRIHK